MTAHLGLGMRSHVIEVARHDGHLLQHLRIFDIEPLKTPRGSLQVFACRRDSPWQRGRWVGWRLATERQLVH